jgi:hypothetical protein
VSKVEWRLQEVKINRATFGWTCDVMFSVKTHQQYTWQWPAVRNITGRWPITALINGVLAARRYAIELAALPGDFNNA